MIELQDVTKSYDEGATFAVEETSLRIDQGELLALIGESGCGKTTTLKMINRLEEPTSGVVQVNGQDVRDADPVALRRNIGYVFQGIGLFPHYSIEENVAAVPNLLKWESHVIERRVDEVLELVGLAPDEYRSRNPQELSGGQQQRVGVARALAAKPDVMLMDEPFGALDPITRSEVQDQFKNIQTQLGLTVVMVTHDMTEALLLADRVAVMRGGRLLQVDPPGDLLNRPQHPYVEELVQMPKRRADRLEALTDEGAAL